MRWKRVNVAPAREEELISYFTKIYAEKGDITRLMRDYNESRDNVNNPDYQRADPIVKEIVRSGCGNSVLDLFFNFVIGVKEVSSYLAESFFDGFGVIKNDFLANLALSIGKKLGDKKSQEYSGTIPKQIKDLSDKCVVEIKKHEADVRDRDVTWEEIIARAKSFDYFVKHHSGHSYYESIETSGSSMKGMCRNIEPVIDDLTYRSEPTGQTTDCCVIF